MARRPVAVTLAGATATFVILALTLGTIAAVASRATGLSMAPSDRGALFFTLWQAAASALLSGLFAVPLARALARRRFPGRSLLLTLLGAPFILPVVVAVLGLLAIFGQTGWLNGILAWMGLPTVSIYGVNGILLAHVFFNLPLATRLLLQGWARLPAEHFRLAQMLGFTPWQRFKLIELPMLREVLPGAMMAIFVICTTSFAVALTLGGGPKATTIELAIYEAFRFEFDLGRASVLALVQLGICALAGFATVVLGVPRMHAATLDRRVDFASGAVLARVLDAIFICAASLFLLSPLVAIALRGFPHLLDLPPSVWQAAFRSVCIALVSSALSLALGLAMAFAAASAGSGGRLAESVSFLTIAASPLVMGAGLYVILSPHVSIRAFALPVTALVNAAMALPFVVRILLPSIKETATRFGPLSATLSMTTFARARWLWWPRLRGPLGFSAGLSAALSMGDLGVIALFAAPDQTTLPLQMYRLMSAYRMDQAMGAALVLLAISLALFWIFERGGGWNADA